MSLKTETPDASDFRGSEVEGEGVSDFRGSNKRSLISALKEREDEGEHL